MIIQFSRTEVRISQILSDFCSTKAIFINSFFFFIKILYSINGCIRDLRVAGSPVGGVSGNGLYCI